MKLFFKKILIFFFPFLLFSLIFDVFLSNQLRKSVDFAQGEYSVWNDIIEGNIHADFVIYGSSRAWVHIDPQIIEKQLHLTSYNLGIDGHNFYFQYLRHQLLLEHNNPPKIVVLSLDMFSLEKRRGLYNLDQFLPYMFYNNQMIKYLKIHQGFSFFDYYIPLLRFSGNTSAIYRSFKNAIVPNQQQLWRNKGFKGMERTWTSDLIKAREKMTFFTAHIDTDLKNLLISFLLECKSKNIQIIFVYTPEFIEGQNFVENREDIISFYEHLASEYNLPFLDYSNDDLCSNKSYFYNASHLNKRGATIFTNKLITDLKPILDQKKVKPYSIMATNP